MIRRIIPILMLFDQPTLVYGARIGPPYSVEAAELFIAGAVKAEVFVAGAAQAEIFVAGASKGEAY